MVVGRALEVEREEQEQQEYLVVPDVYPSSSKISKSAGTTGSTIGMEQNGENIATTTRRILKPKKNNKDEGKNDKKGNKAGKKGAKAQATPQNRDDSVPPTLPPTLVPPVPATPMAPPVPQNITPSPVPPPITPSPVPQNITPSPVPPSTGPSTGYGLQPDCLLDDPSTFNICLDMVSLDGTYKSWMDAVVSARDRWQRVIVGDTFPAFSIELSNKTVAVNLPPLVDDMYLAVLEYNIDGVGSILGGAAVTVEKRKADGHVLPVAAHIVLDISDLPRMLADNSIRGVLEHEMGHALGFGNLWVQNDLHTGILTDPNYHGVYAQEAWKAMGCSGNIPIETDGGAGTAGSHWDEECLNLELMTGFDDSPVYFSNLTMGALLDLGYSVNSSAAEPFTLDQLSKIDCAASCPEARGNFSRDDGMASTTNSTTGGASALPYVEGNTTSIAKTQAENRDAILSAAAAVLQKNRANAPLSLPEGFRYVGGDSMSVLTRGPDGHIKETVVTWDEVQAYITSEAQVVV